MQIDSTQFKRNLIELDQGGDDAREGIDECGEKTQKIQIVQKVVLPLSRPSYHRGKFNNFQLMNINFCIHFMTVLIDPNTGTVVVSTHVDLIINFAIFYDNLCLCWKYLIPMHSYLVGVGVDGWMDGFSILWLLTIFQFL